MHVCGAVLQLVFSADSNVGVCCVDSFEKLPLNRDQLRNEVDVMRSVLPNIGSPVVLCHNDLLLRNIIYNEDKRELP